LAGASADNVGVIRLLLLVLLAAGAGLLLVSRHNAQAAEARFADVAAEIARRDVRVRCQGVIGEALDVGAEAGSVQFDAVGRPSDTAELKRGVCTSLRSFAGDVADPEFGCVVRDHRCPKDVLRSMWAVHTLAHEAWHLAGEKNEAVTECYALQTTAWASQRLGASPFEGQAIARYVTAHMYPDMPTAYRSADCRDGGPLDLRPASAVWP
jgi:hypothetical protein